MPQVRLDDDIAAVLDEHDGSLSKATNLVLRKALKMPPKVKRKRRPPGSLTQPTAPAPIAPPKPSKPATRKTPARRQQIHVGRGRCAHPIGRRIGTMCAQCGEAVR